MRPPASELAALAVEHLQRVKAAVDNWLTAAGMQFAAS
jgi:hypothetical protein